MKSQYCGMFFISYNNTIINLINQSDIPTNNNNNKQNEIEIQF